MIPKSGVRFSDKIMRTKGKRSAERRMPSMSALTQTSGRDLRHSSAPRLRAPSKRGAPAFRRPRSRHSPKALTPMAQPQNRVSSRHGAPGVLPVRRARLELSTLRADRSFCRPTGPGAARVRIGNSARGDRPSLRLSGLPFRKGALGERVGAHVTIAVTSVKIASRSQ
jgi:hypothetical protein